MEKKKRQKPLLLRFSKWYRKKISPIDLKIFIILFAVSIILGGMTLLGSKEMIEQNKSNLLIIGLSLVVLAFTVIHTLPIINGLKNESLDVAIYLTDAAMLIMIGMFAFVTSTFTPISGGQMTSGLIANVLPWIAIIAWIFGIVYLTLGVASFREILFKKEQKRIRQIICSYCSKTFK